ncbi:head-tail adaptor protein [Xanthobacteraceae bacterium A53D]
MRHLVAWEKRAAIDDGYGNTEGDFVEQYRCHAERTAMRGGETVIASRLQGTQPYVLRIRQCAAARTITPDWQARDVRSGQVTQIKSIADPDDRGAYLDIMVVEGVAG